MMRHVTNQRINHSFLKVILSLLQVLSFLNIYSFFYAEKYINDFVSLLLLLVELIILMNLTDFVKKKDFLIEFSLLSIILLIRLSLLNEFLKFELVKYVGITVVLISMITHIRIIGNISNNSKNENKTLRNANTSDVEIQKSIHNKILNLFKLNNKADNNEDAKKYIWITTSAFIAIVLFLGKFIIDIKNMFSIEYTYGMAVIVVYVVLNNSFIVINCIKSKTVGCNMVIDFAETLLFLLGANLFVFAQRGYARFQVLVAVAYLCCLFVLKTRDLIKKFEFSEN